MLSTGTIAILDIVGGSVKSAYKDSGFSLSTGSEGKFLTVSLAGMCAARSLRFALVTS